MPQYEYFGHNCKKAFSKVLTLTEYQAGKVACPNCRSKKVEQTAGRWGQPEEVAGTAVYLASRASDFVTGTTIRVDGGYAIR